MLLRLEAPIRERLEKERVPRRVAQWIAGGHTQEDRARRGQVALYARARVRSQGWPDLWVLAFFAKADATTNTNRRAQGLRPLGVKKTCATATLPAAPPPPTRTTKKVREAARLREVVAAIMVAIDAEWVARTGHAAEPEPLGRIAGWLRDVAKSLDEEARLRR
jgi:hypothetical protein